MTINQCIREWESKKRTMGCVSATEFLCKRVPGFKPLRLTLISEDGFIYQHEISTNGSISIDLAPYANKPKGEVT